MYLRAIHAEFDVPVLRRFVRDNPLGILITALHSDDFPTIQCTHVPWILDVDDESSETELGILRGHIARSNPHSKAMTEAVRRCHASNGSLEEEVTVMFNGPADSYVTPKFYTETKPATGKVAPTWNYSAVQAYGTGTVLWDSASDETSSYLQKQITDLTRHSEVDIMRYTGKESPQPWEVGDAPSEYINILKKNIVGVEIRIKRLEGKFKMNQEVGKQDREGVIAGFRALDTQNAHKIADTVERRGNLKDERAARRAGT